MEKNILSTFPGKYYILKYNTNYIHGINILRDTCYVLYIVRCLFVLMHLQVVCMFFL